MPGRQKLPGALLTENQLFAAVFDVPPAWRLPDNFKVNRYGGMQLCQRLRTKGDQDLVVTWWKDAASYDAVWSDDVANELKLPATPKFSGTAAEREPAEEKKKWLPWLFTVLAALVTLLGNFTQLENYGAWLIAEPKAKILTSVLPTRVVQGQTGAIEFKIHNRSKGSCRINELTAEASPAGGLNYDALIGPLTPFEPGELRTITWPIVPNLPGGQRIKLSGEAKAGRAQPRLILEPAFVEVEVWSQLEMQPHANYLRRLGENMAEFKIEAHHGKPLTKTIAYQANGPAGLSFTNVTPNSEMDVANAGSTVAAIAWKQDATPLVPQLFKLFVRASKSLTESDWRKYEQQITVNAALAGQ